MSLNLDSEAPSPSPSSPNFKPPTNWRRILIFSGVILILLSIFPLLNFKSTKSTKSNSISTSSSTTTTTSPKDQNKLSASKSKPNICQTEACITAGRWLYDSINFTANPCDDFYKYACGNWIANHQIPDAHTSLNAFSILQDKVTQSLKKLLEQTVRERNLKEPIAKSVQLALDLYEECMDQETQEKLGLTPVKELLFQLLGTSWPILNPSQLKNATISNFQSAFSRLKSAGVSPIISFYIGIDLNHTETKIIEFTTPSFSMGRKQYSKLAEYHNEIRAAQKYMHDVASLFAGKGVDEKLVKERLDEIWKLESKLVMFTRTQEESRDATLGFNKMRLIDFKKLTSNRINWTALLNSFISPLNLTYRFNDTDLVIVEDIPYYQNMTQLLLSTPLHVLYNYMGARFARGYSYYGGDQMKAINFEYSKITDGIKEMEPFWEKCFNTVSYYFQMPVSRLYVDHQVIPGTKERAEEMVTYLQAAFKHIVQNEASWLDEQTKARTLEKAAATRYVVAYPDWILDNTELDRIFGFSEGNEVTVKKGRFFESVIDIKRFRLVKEWRELHKPRNVMKDNLLPPILVNAGAMLSSNAIALPVAMLQPPFFDPDRPFYLNYASMGETIGHEMTHHFDDEGSQHDNSGRLENWWTNETKSRFDNGRRCFIEQYGAIIDADTGKKLNGINTLGENIADNGGIREAFYAFQSMALKSKMELIPLMEAYTFEQLFFLSLGQNYCSNSRLEVMKRGIDSDTYTPDRYRLNVPLGNFEQFAKAFNCPVGSKMNPVEKCRLW